jgi:eukaryotic-like serine/threonine-protein kinase
MGFQPGDKVGDYEVLGVLGSGGMGAVYKVRNTISDRIEAMKVLLPNLDSQPELADRFLREIKVQASLDHPNIASLYTAQRVGNQLLMIMEYVEGTTLDQRLKSGPIPIPEALDYVKQVLAALGFAHARGVVHRDIKPSNMMRTADGKIKLMDFGIAKMVADRHLTQTGQTLGSLYYMSPEQIQGATVLDARSDLYSLGVALYEMVTGRRPFQGDSEYSIMAAHLQDRPVAPIEIDPKLPAVLNDVILTAIAKDPAQRFQSAEVFAKVLDKITSTPSVTAAPPPPVAYAAPPPPPTALAPPAASSSRRGLYVALGAVVAIAVLAAVALLGPRWYRTLAGGKAEPAKLPEAVQTAPAEPAPPAQAVPQPPAVVVESSPAPAAPEPAARPRRAVRAAESPRVTQPVTPAEAAQVQPPPPQAKPDPRIEEELGEQRERMMLMGTRVAAAQQSIQKIEHAQSQMGLSLRGDIREASHQVEFYLDEAQTALAARNAAKARQNLDKAERSLGIVERFLGR